MLNFAGYWAEFDRAAPELAGYFRERIQADQVILLGTIRKDGSPRISPVESHFQLFAIDIQSAARITAEGDVRQIAFWQEGELTKKYRHFIDGRREELE
jgi:hypothetical protein